MVRRNIFKGEGFWKGRSYKLQIYIFMILIAISVFFVAKYSDSGTENVLQRVTSASVVEVAEPVLDNTPKLKRGVGYEIGDKLFIVNKIDKESQVRSSAAYGTYWVFTFTVTSDKPYVPEPRIIYRDNVIAPDEIVQEFYNDQILKQVEGETRGLKVFDIPDDFDEIYLDFDINLNSSLYRLK